jgi:hypothetical protein
MNERKAGKTKGFLDGINGIYEIGKTKAGRLIRNSGNQRNRDAESRNLVLRT